jgi:hypothetical protein
MAKNLTPGSKPGARLRQWAAPSYDASTGRCAASSMEEQRSYGFDAGERCTPSKQIPTGFEGRDRRATQNRTPVKHRPVTESHEN